MSAAIDLAMPLVKRFEGLYLTTYTCPAGKETIGYGHTGNDVSDGQHITEAQADALLDADLSDAESDVDELVNVDCTNYELAALISFVFNLGGPALRGSTLLKKLNACDKAGAAQEFLKWDKAHVNGQLVALQGLTLRRQAESRLFATSTWS
jgi:lysozyme